MNVQINESWKEELHEEFTKPYFENIVTNIKNQKSTGKTIYPPGKFIFHAFDCTPFSKVKAVILGQDPYHNPGQAHGLCFSVPVGIVPPPSLINIFKELKADLDIDIPHNGNLEKWAQQGVLLLNATLTVEENQPNSHSTIGWHIFTDQVIKHVSDHKNHVVFLLWGKFAQQKEALIDKQKHLVLKAAHPSPFSAYNGFFGCKHFSKANEWLQSKGLEQINWQLQFL